MNETNTYVSFKFLFYGRGRVEKPYPNIDIFNYRAKLMEDSARFITKDE